MSTDEHPLHVKCPEHNPPENPSWCKFKIATFEKKPAPEHTPRDLAKYVRPVYRRLANRDLLERCTLGATQNQNESFNNLIWIHASKTQILSLPTIELAVHIAILHFNEGREVGTKHLFAGLKMEISPRIIEY